MRSSKQDDRRTAERRADNGKPSATGERRVVENRGVAKAMGDALEDILKWERASERSMRIAAEAQGVTSDAPVSTH